MLVLALLISTLLLIMGMSILTVRSRQYDASHLEQNALQARLLAEAGVEDAMQKLAKDPSFPPPQARRQHFGYAEQIYRPSSPSKPMGCYVVDIDVSNRVEKTTDDITRTQTYDYPGFTILINSCGQVFDDTTSLDAATGATGSVACSRTIVAELDVSPKTRGQAVTGLTTLPLPQPGTSYDAASASYYTNDDYMRLVRWEDSGVQ